MLPSWLIRLREMLVVELKVFLPQQLHIDHTRSRLPDTLDYTKKATFYNKEKQIFRRRCKVEKSHMMSA